jgi:hypothetical protein
MRVAMSHSKGHEILAALRNPLEGDPRVEKSYSDATPIFSLTVSVMEVKCRRMSFTALGAVTLVALVFVEPSFPLLPSSLTTCDCLCPFQRHLAVFERLADGFDPFYPLAY